MKHFKSVKRIGEASAEELAQVVGSRRAAILRDFFEKKAAEKEA